MNTSETIAAPAAVFDTEALRRGIEERDAATLIELYSEDAEMHIVDGANPPSAPRILRGRSAIGAYLEDLCGRDMTHTLERVLANGDHAAYVQVCAYPNGTQVLCVAVLDLSDGRIVRQVGAQAWDE
jgi:ketosteroid isomerase-like protein